MDFYKGRHVEFVGKDHHVKELTLWKQFCDQQDGISSSVSGLPDLVGVNQKVLTEDWEVHMLANQGQISQGTTKEGLIRQA
jgi:hypothetical protein